MYICLCIYELTLGIGDWGLGIGDWGLGPIPNPHILHLYSIQYLIIYSFNDIKF